MGMGGIGHGGCACGVCCVVCGMTVRVGVLSVRVGVSHLSVRVAVDVSNVFERECDVSGRCGGLDGAAICRGAVCRGEQSRVVSTRAPSEESERQPTESYMIR